ncbi:MAG: hypothetical protein KKA05_10355 [Alphaproteobacteria bacterium]|nr:hypothetical protein [Alphaproteobacteria bacterium]
MITASTSRAYNAGWSARCLVDHMGAAKTHVPCPETKDAEEHRQWTLGWDEADEYCGQEHRDRMIATGRR